MIETVHEWLHDRKPDAWVQRRQYKLNFGVELNIDHPQTFNEKLHWLMRHDRRSVVTQCADKLAVRDYVRDRVGAAYLTTLYGVWNDLTAIDFDSLPPRCVLKTTHGSGQNIFVRDASQFDREAARRMLAEWLTRSNYWLYREWAYKDISPRVIAEELLGEGQSPPDYKFFCFDGVPRMIQVDTDRFNRHTRAFLSPAWTPLPFTMGYPSPDTPSQYPKHLAQMLAVAETLSAGHPFVRVDLYDLPKRVVFGEMTWYPEGATGHFTPDIWDEKVGSWLKLPQAASLRILPSRS